jgi:hypothetical protein
MRKLVAASLVFLASFAVGMADDNPRPYAPLTASPKKKWIADPLAPAGVKNLVENLPSIKNLYLKSFDDRIAATKLLRSTIAKEPEKMGAVVSGGAPGGAICQVDSSANAYQRKRLRDCDSEVVRLYKFKKAAQADELWLPESMVVANQVDAVGKLDIVHIFQIIDGKNALIRTDGGLIWISEVDTSKMVADTDYSLSQWVVVKGTKQYMTVGQFHNVVIRLEAIDLKKYLIESDAVAVPSPSLDPSK